MQIIGCLIIWVFAAIFFWGAKISVVKEEDFSEYPIAEGTVIGTHDHIGGRRWMVQFITADGKKIIGADHIRSENTFHPERYVLPKRGNTEKFYYWEQGRNRQAKISGVPIVYYIHFCNEDFYTLIKERARRRRIYFLITSAVIFLLGVMVLIWG